MVRGLWEQISIAASVCWNIHLSSPSPIVICFHLQSVDLYCLPLPSRGLSPYLLYLCQTVMSLIMHSPLSSPYWGVIFHPLAVYKISWLLKEIRIHIYCHNSNIFCACWIICIKTLI